MTTSVKNKMFDYQIWIERAVSFTGNLAKPSSYFNDIRSEISVQPPLMESELIEIASKIDKQIPQELANFWLNGSRHCDCTYFCEDAQSDIDLQIETIFGGFQEIYGGASLIDAVDLPRHLLNCKDWAEETWVAEYPQDKSFWINSVPFAEMNNGDYLALKIVEAKDNPPVIYLSHDDESSMIADSFTDFLTHWEQLCYVGPEIWMLQNFRDENGYINSDLYKAAELRKLLGSSN